MVLESMQMEIKLALKVIKMDVSGLKAMQMVIKGLKVIKMNISGLMNHTNGYFRF